jgi:hypothetical protein
MESLKECQKIIEMKNKSIDGRKFTCIFADKHKETSDDQLFFTNLPDNMKKEKIEDLLKDCGIILRKVI